MGTPKYEIIRLDTSTRRAVPAAMTLSRHDVVIQTTHGDSAVIVEMTSVRLSSAQRQHHPQDVLQSQPRYPTCARRECLLFVLVNRQCGGTNGLASRSLPCDKSSALNWSLIIHRSTIPCRRALGRLYRVATKPTQRQMSTTKTLNTPDNQVVDRSA